MRFIDHPGFTRLLAGLAARGYELVGPTVSDGAIRLEPIEGIDDLPRGIGEEQEAGRYRPVARGDGRLFGFAHGPDSAKRYLFPGREVVATATRTNGHLKMEDSPPEARPVAFVGLRPCDLAAIAVQDRVFLEGPAPDPHYAARRRAAFIVTVDCAEPGGTCFCTSMGGGPRADRGFDLAATEIDDGFLVRVGTERGDEVLQATGSREATAGEVAVGDARALRAARSMGREVDTTELRDLLYRNREHPKWAEVAERCLA